MARQPEEGFARSFGRGAIDPSTGLAGRRRSDQARSSIVVFGHVVLMVALLSVIAGTLGLHYGTRVFDAPGPLTQEKAVVVARGSGTTDIADKLEREGVITSAVFFTTASKILGKAGELKAGEYIFPPRVPMREVMRLLVEGKGIQHAVTIPEGYTSQMIVDKLRADPVLVGDVIVIPREGTLLPDTYVFERGATRQQILSRMEAAQKKILDEIWKRRSAKVPLKSPAELVTLASIVEKETGKADERPRVASVFINRLAKNMRLQSDPTIIYGMVGGVGRLDRPLTRADIDTPTPYNTYTINGLPPGPIANPGRAAMEAVANPSQTKDIYFVADGTGGHAFAETLEQHNRNVARWRQLQAAPPPDPALPGDAPAPSLTGPGPAPGSQQPVAPTSGDQTQTRGFVDPVANTRRDPLLNQTFDLNSPQTVPQIQ